MARGRVGTNMRRLPPGVTVYAINEATTLGERRQVVGHLIVELPDGSLHRLTGAEMSAWNEALSGFVKRWRLDENETYIW